MHALRCTVVLIFYYMCTLIDIRDHGVCDNPRVGSRRDVCRAQVQLVCFGRACGRRGNGVTKGSHLHVRGPESFEAALSFCCCLVYKMSQPNSS